MFAVLRVVLEAELAVEQVLVAIEPDVVHAVGGQDQKVQVGMWCDQFTTHFSDDVIEDTSGIICAFAQQFDLKID